MENSKNKQKYAVNLFDLFEEMLYGDIEVEGITSWADAIELSWGDIRERDVDIKVMSTAEVILTADNFANDLRVEVPTVVYNELQQARSVMGYYKHLIDKNVVSDLTEEESMAYDWIREDEERFFKAMVYGMKKKEQLYYVFIKEASLKDGFLNLDTSISKKDGDDRNALFLSTNSNLDPYQTIFTEEEIKALPKGDVWWEFRKPVEDVVTWQSND